MQRFAGRSRLRGGSFKRGTGAAMLAGSLSIMVGGLTPGLHAQAVSVNGGSIQGTITDSTGAVVPHAQILVTNPQTGSKKTLITDGAGLYTFGPVNPGEYHLAVTSAGYSTLSVDTVVKTGTVTNGNFKLQVGASTETVQVTAGSIQVNTDQSSVSNVLTSKQIDTLPINGRNFLDLAQLEPGVQLQSGESFDPTKAGYSAIGFNGGSGRTTRILLDGQDITDETVGTTIFNVSQGAVDQFQITRANNDVSGEIGASGQVLVSTRTGTNNYHGELFYNFQDNNAGFATIEGQNAPFQRNQFGGSIGGPVLKDKLFFFANSERIKQDESTPLQLGSLFAQSIEQAHPNLPSPFRETYSTGRLDYDAPYGVHLFARVNYDVNSAVTSGNSSYDIYANRDNTPGIAGGADFVTGKFTHSIRGSYEKFHNLIGDATGSGVYVAEPGVLIRYAAQNLYTGANDLAPQDTYQSDKQIRYDGSWTKGTHNIKYGASLNDILQGGFASFYGLAPRITLNTASLIAGADPTNLTQSYTAGSGVRFGNGLGYFTTPPSFGAPAGGAQDYRLGAYVGDSWKITPSLVVNYGVRYQRDTGRTDNAINPIPCSAINTTNFPNPPCTGNQLILDQFGPGLGKRITQPNLDFNPQLGFAYSLGSDAKTVVSGSIGVFRENTVFNAAQFDTPFKLASGLFLDDSHTLCGGTYQINFPGQTAPVTSYGGESFQQICGEPLATSAAKFAGVQAAYQAATQAAGPAGNGSFIGNTLAIPTGNSAYSPNFKTPYATQVNFSVQRQIGRGTVVTASYIHSVTNHIAQTIDQNHVGDARFFNKAAAQNAIAAALTACGVPGLDEAIIACPGLHPGGGGLTITDLSKNGLDSGNVVLSGRPAAGQGKTPDTGAAFAGVNPAVGNGFFAFPTGRSSYDALQLNLREQKTHPAPGLADSNFEASYAYGREVGSSGAGSDQFFVGSAWDYNNPTKYIGYGALDHRHTISFGGSVTVVHGPQIGLIGHIYSAPPSNLLLDNLSGAAGQIFTSDPIGDGSANQHLLPETNPGSYMRSANGGNLQTIINNYNAKYGNQLSPAGQTVVNSGLITAAQLQKLGGVLQPIANVPQNRAIENPPFRQIDASASYPLHVPFLSETFTLVPGVAMYNVANLGNYNNPNYSAGAGNGTLLNTADAGQSNYLNGPSNYSVKNANRIARGSGTFDAGGPRSTEFQLKLEF